MSIEDSDLFCAHFTFFSDCFEIFCHHCKRLHRTMFKLAKSAYCSFIRSITAKMKASDSLDCNNTALSNRFSRISDRFSAPFFSADQIHFRTTFIAADRLCIISSGYRIIIFLCTIRTHRKLFHTSPLTVIRQRIQYRQPWPTAGAVNKRMQISPILRVKHFLFAFLTDCDIRRDKDFSLCLFTFDNIKLCITL